LTFREEFTNPITGKYFMEGDKIKRQKFAKTLREIGNSGSADILYSGSMGEKIVKEIQDLGGIITMEDMKNFE
jgi:gamma-glutamyltranspeptidase